MYILKKDSKRLGNIRIRSLVPTNYTDFTAQKQAEPAKKHKQETKKQPEKERLSPIPPKKTTGGDG